MEHAILEANLLLQAALAENKESAVREALEKGANVNYEGPDGGRPLHTASCMKGFLNIVDLLLKHGADVNVSDKEGFTPLMVAALNGRYEVVRLLLRKEANPNVTRLVMDETGQQLDTGETALHLAMNSNSFATATALIDAGADVLAFTKDDKSTPLHLAAEFGSMMSAKAILKHPTTSTDEDNVHVRNGKEQTPSEVAIAYKHEELAHFLELWERPRSETEKMMISALINSDASKLEEALKKGANPNLNIPRGARPLHTAALKGAVPLVQTLLLHGAEVDATDSEGYTPLMVASLNGHLDVVKELLNYRANPKVSRPKCSGEGGGGETALHMAVASGSRTLIRTLLENGADVNVQCSSGNSALHYAVEFKAYDVAEELLRHPDCLPAPMNEEYMSPRSLAVGLDDTRLLNMFEAPKKAQDDPENPPARRIISDDGSLMLRINTGSVIPPSDAVYKNISSPRGQVLIINYARFGKYSLRKGSSVDVMNLRNLFEKMGYKVHDKENLSREETLEILKNFSCDPDLKKADSLFVCMMSHGLDGNTFYTSDDKEITVHEVYDFFKEDACPDMRGKPKVFLFNFCRGKFWEKRSKQGCQTLSCDSLSNTVSTPEVLKDSVALSEKEHRIAASKEPEPDPVDAPINQLSVFAKTEALSCDSLSNTVSTPEVLKDSVALSEEEHRIAASKEPEPDPVDAPINQLSVFATTEGIMALRDKTTGTYFVNALCRIFAKYAHMYHLVELIGKLSQHMERERSTTPATENVHFTKKLYLNPKAPEP